MGNKTVRRILTLSAVLLLFVVSVLGIVQHSKNVKIRKEQISTAMKTMPSSDQYKTAGTEAFTMEEEKSTSTILSNAYEQVQQEAKAQTEEKSKEDKLTELMEKAQEAQQVNTQTDGEDTDADSTTDSADGTADAADSAADSADSTKADADTEDSAAADSDEGDGTEEDTATNTTGNGHKIAVDAGHQGQGNSEQEPIGPGASETKAKVASGTYGPASGLNEYELNLAVSLKLRDELQSRGYEVYMIRETNDVDISNSERAQLAADSGADILVRVHANGSDDTSLSGALSMAPGADNPYLSQDLISSSMTLSQDMIDAFCAATGANNMGVQRYNNMSGINWSSIPVTIVEMGFMTNAGDDTQMADESYQFKMAKGMADGVDAYFNG